MSVASPGAYGGGLATCQPASNRAASDMYQTTVYTALDLTLHIKAKRGLNASVLNNGNSEIPSITLTGSQSKCIAAEPKETLFYNLDLTGVSSHPALQN